MFRGPGVTVVIPAYNEERGITAGVHAVQQALSSACWEHEVIVVDDGSTDATARLAEESGAQIMRLETNQGYGAALKAGIDRAKHEWVAIIDADGTYPASDLPRMLEHVPANDMVVGARTGPEVH